MWPFKPAWKSKNERRAIRAVKRITNEEKLKKIVIELPRNSEVSAEALKKIYDQEFLKKRATEHSYFRAREAAIENITDQEFLKEIVLNYRIYNSNTTVYEKAIENITDQEFLKEIAVGLGDYRYEICLSAAKSITDPAVSYYVATNAKSDLVKLKAYERCENKNKTIIDYMSIINSWPSPYYDRERRENIITNLIEHISKDRFAASIFWEQIKREVSSHHDHYDSSTSCYNSPHQDYGTGMTIPPYPFED